MQRSFFLIAEILYVQKRKDFGKLISFSELELIELKAKQVQVQVQKGINLHSVYALISSNQFLQQESKVQIDNYRRNQRCAFVKRQNQTHSREYQDPSHRLISINHFGCWSMFPIREGWGIEVLPPRAIFDFVRLFFVILSEQFFLVQFNRKFLNFLE